MDADLGHFLTNQFGDRYLPKVNGSLFRALGARAVFSRHFKDSFKAENTLFIILGTDSGLLIDFIEREPLPRGTRFLFIESPEILAALGRDNAAPDHLRCCTPDEWKTSAVELDIGTYFYLDRVRLVKSISATDAHWPEYQSIAVLVESEILPWRFRQVSQMGSRNFIETMLKNIAENQVPAQVLRDTFAGKTGVLLAGGPSLDDLLPWVRGHRDDLVVIAVSRISKRLLEFGLTPDIVVSVDPFQVSYDVSKEMLSFPDSVLLAHSYHIVPSLLAQWGGHAVYIGDRLPWESELNPANTHGSGPTVSNSAIQVAAHMGLGRLILAGMDLCHSQMGHTHAQGSSENNAGPRVDDTGLVVETYGGWQASTTVDYYQALKTLEQQARVVRERGMRIVNPSLASAKAENVDFEALESIELAPLDRAAVEVLRDAAKPLSTLERRSYYQQVRKELAEAKTKLVAMSRLCDEALECNAKLHDGDDVGRNFRFKKRMDKIERKFDRTYKRYASLVKEFGMPWFIRLSSPVAMEEWSDKDLRRYGDGYYSAYKGSLMALSDLMDDALTRIESRIAEESEQPDLHAIAGQWIKDGQFGRGRVWKKRHPAMLSRLNEAERQQLAGIESAHAEDLRIAEERNRQRSETNRADWLRAVPARFVRLYEQKAARDLEAALRQLDKYDTSEAGVIRHYGAGLLAMLESRFDEAMTEFQILIDEGQLVEEVLRRVLELSIANNDFDSALMAGEALAGLSPVNMPHYAQMLKLVGRIEDALDVYHAYLQQIPDDLDAMLRLGGIYHEIGADDAAAEAFGFVLERDPSHHAAIALWNSVVKPVAEQRAMAH